MVGKRGGALPAPFWDRFWAKATRLGDDECWPWTGARNDSGYGVILLEDHRTLGYAHRVLYERTVGPVPARLTLDHTCNVRHCVNPAHLEPVTVLENIRRGTERRTHCRRGHEYAVFAGLKAKGGRYCRECQRLTVAASRRKAA